MGFFRRLTQPRDQLPDAARSLPMADGERVLAAAEVEDSALTLVATTATLAAVGAGGAVALRRPWCDISGWAWEPNLATMSVMWREGGRGSEWTLERRAGARFADVAFERMRASIVLSEDLLLDGRLCGKVSIRKDLADGRLFDQVVYVRGVRPGTPEVEGAVAALRAELRDQVGLPAQPE